MYCIFWEVNPKGSVQGQPVQGVSSLQPGTAKVCTTCSRTAILRSFYRATETTKALKWCPKYGVNRTCISTFLRWLQHVIIHVHSISNSCKSIKSQVVDDNFFSVNYLREGASQHESRASSSPIAALHLLGLPPPLTVMGSGGVLLMLSSSHHHCKWPSSSLLDVLWCRYLVIGTASLVLQPYSKSTLGPPSSNLRIEEGTIPFK